LLFSCEVPFPSTQVIDICGSLLFYPFFIHSLMCGIHSWTLQLFGLVCSHGSVKLNVNF